MVQAGSSNLVELCFSRTFWQNIVRSIKGRSFQSIDGSADTNKSCNVWLPLWHTLVWAITQRARQSDVSTDNWSSFFYNFIWRNEGDLNGQTILLKLRMLACQNLSPEKFLLVSVRQLCTQPVWPSLYDTQANISNLLIFLSTSFHSRFTFLIFFFLSIKKRSRLIRLEKFWTFFFIQKIVNFKLFELSGANFFSRSFVGLSSKSIPSSIVPRCLIRRPTIVIAA